MSRVFKTPSLFYLVVALVILLLIVSCSKKLPEVELKPAPDSPPEWASDVIWYQIFVERFHNGDKSNDPKIENIKGTYPGYIPENWSLTPWTQDWYKEDEYFKQVHGKLDFLNNPINSFDAKTSLRRYGGDIQGVIDKLDYLTELGVNAIYFNPINDAPSAHKYDARHWRHIDVNFGPDPVGDIELIADEDPADPSTWVLTSADKLFLEFLQMAKSKGIRVILDYSWNHTGHTHWAWRDLLENQQESEFADWYWVKQFDDLTTAENEFEYRGWFGVFDLPEIQETVYEDHSKQVRLFEGNIKSDSAKSHILAVTRRWLDPNGDGDPSDGVDGYRLDVAAELPLGFWREYRTYVKSINPEAFLVGEIWWEKWPDDLFDPAPVLKGDIFDSVMNYRWYRAARQYFSKSSITMLPSELEESLSAQRLNIADSFYESMMNMSASHDSPRLLTSFNNKNKYKYNAKESQNARYNANKPSQETMQRAKLLLAHQFTYIGSPQIWAGDEMGMWGSDDPHNRKPLIWSELEFENETSHPKALIKSEDSVRFNHDLFEYYQFLIDMRKSNPVLRQGQVEFTDVNDARKIFGYKRAFKAGDASENDNQMAWVVFNSSRYEHTLLSPQSLLKTNTWQVWHNNAGLKMLITAPSEQLLLPANSVTIVIAE